MQSGRRTTGWRRLAAATWSGPADPQFYGDLEIDAAAAQRYVERLRGETGVHVTLTHLAVKAVAEGLRQVPDLNVRLARGRAYPRSSVDVFVIVAIGRDELTGHKVRDADRKSVVDIARELAAEAGRLRRGEGGPIEQGKALLDRLPTPLARLALGLAARVTSDLDLDLSRFGLPREAFGGAMVSAIGGTGIAHAYSPLAPYYRVPLLVLLGAVREQPVVVEGRVLARPVLTLTATFDHRYTDGLMAVEFARVVDGYLRDPEPAERPAGAVPLQRAGG